MTQYYVYSSEVVTYRTLVEADSPDQAHQLILSGEVELGEPRDGAHFEIDDVVPAFNVVE
jgi:hypothetical protein